MSGFLSKFDELASATSGRSSSLSFLTRTTSISQHLTKNKKVLFILFTLVSLVTILIETNQHEALLDSLPTVTITHNNSNTDSNTDSNIDSSSNSTNIDEQQQQQQQEEPEDTPPSDLFAKFQPVPMKGQRLSELFQSDDEAPKFALSDSDIDQLLSLPLTERFDLLLPYKPAQEGQIPRNIFQQHKSTNLDELGRDITRYINSFKVANEGAGFEHHLYDNKKIERFLLREYGLLFPEVVELYHALPKNIMRYDLFRYLVLYAYGGTYSDTDTEASKPVLDWLSYNDTVYGDANTIGAVVGVEGECDCQDWERIEGRRIQLCQWTFQFKPHHPILKLTILNILRNYHEKYNSYWKVFTAWDGQTYDFNKEPKEYLDGVIEFTGPTLFTDSFYEYLNSLDSETFHINSPNDHEQIYKNLRNPHPDLTRHSYVWEHDVNTNVGWENFTNIMEPLVINKDIMVVPRFYFNPRKAEEFPDNQYWVKHNYHGTWKQSPV
ncbi:hypothetical protein WICPIJ_002290 [Wickerhamomyces pijperi]|uniref:Glycosyltransferase family 32 protein n=1 Tax=Wickerhamomyces pijperi TaxID=599730 RepID=A0A9P8QBZ8_WICPI|nr:hypothetical protein WICPIJ_002290 [Wickerhamomyces pijperi]